LKTDSEEITSLKNIFQKETNHIAIPVLEENVKYNVLYRDLTFTITESVAVRNLVAGYDNEISDKKIIYIDCPESIIDELIEKIKAYSKNNFKDVGTDQIVHYVCNEYGSWDNSSS
jgi:hypothetical protein